MTTARFFRFGPFELNTRTGELRENGTTLRLQEQSFQILLMLLTHPGEVVLRQEIRQRLWPEDTVVEFDHSINAAIKRLRSALGESAEAPRYIETLSKRGYRFVGDVGRVGGNGDLPVASEAEPPQRMPVSGLLRPLAISISIGLLIALLAAFVATRVFRQSPVTATRVLFSVTPPENAFFGNTPSPAFSPDGQRFVFSAYYAGIPQGALWMRALDAVVPRALPGTESGGLPFWSPDGRSVGFFTGHELKRIDLGGAVGAEKTMSLCPVTGYYGGTWNRDGVIVFSTREPILYRIAAWGGSPVPVTRPQGGIAAYPSFLPDGHHFLFETYTPMSDQVTIRVGSLESPESKVLFQADSNAIFAHGRLLYVRGERLLAQPFDAAKVVLAGVPVPLGEPVAAFAGYGNFSASENGPLVYLPKGDTPPFELVWFDRKGARLSTLAGVRTRPSLFYPPNLSPDQKSVASVHREFTKSDIWLFAAATGMRTRLTFDSAPDTAPIWSPDSRTIVFASARRGHFDLYSRAAYGVAPEQLLYADESDKYPTSWSHDGKYLLYDRVGADDATSSIWVLPLLTSDKDTQPKPFPLPQAAEKARLGQFSPDGRWIAYQSDESGRPEIYLCPFSPDARSGGQKRQISTGEGEGVRWHNDGREIFYLSGRRLLAARLDITGDTVRVNEEQQIIGPLSILGFDVSADGQRFLVRTRTQQLLSQPLTVAENWTAGLK